MNARGFGLVLVVVVLAVLGLLSLTAFGIARRELRHATEMGFAAEAFEAAESGLAAAASAVDLAGAPLLVQQPGPGTSGDQARVTTTVLRLTPSLVLLQATGERLDGAGEVLARRRLGLVGTVVAPPDSGAPRFVPLRSRGWTQLYD